jgi:hypothetical protein
MATRDTRLTPIRWLTGALVLCGAFATVAAQKPRVVVNDDDMTIRGCVGESDRSSLDRPVLVWTKGGIMLSNALSVQAGHPQQLPERVFYWPDGGDKLSKHVGQRVEVESELGDFKKGQIKVDRDGEFTKIEMKLGGDTEHARVPTAWLGAPRDEGKVDIVARKIKIKDVEVLGVCTAR